MSDSSDDDEPVGYGRPPRKHQFKKGGSANPRGRPRGASKQNPIKKALERKVTVTIDGKRRRISVAEALALQLTQRGLGGDRQAAKDALNLARHYETNAPTSSHQSQPEQKKPYPKIVLKVVSAPTNAGDAISEVLIALGACTVEGPITQIPTWVVEAAFAHFGWDASRKMDLFQLRSLMADPDDLDGIVRKARRLALKAS